MSAKDFFSRWLASRHAVPVASGLAIAALVALVQFAAPSLVERIGLLIFDSWQRLVEVEPGDDPVRVVDIDEQSIRKLGQWPWPRSELALLNERLSAAGARAIAYDVVFSESDRTSPGEFARHLEREAQAGIDEDAAGALARRLAALPDHDERFAQSIASAPVVLGFFLSHREEGRPVDPKAGIALAGSLPSARVPQYRGAVQSLPLFVEAARGIGSLSRPGDADGIVRRIPLLAIKDGQLLPSLSLEAVRVATGEGTVIVEASDASGETRGAGGAVSRLIVASREVPVAEDGRIWLRFAPQLKPKTISASVILLGELSDDELKREFEGRVVFVGASAPGLRDLVATPIGREVPGVFLHAMAARQLLTGDFLVRPDWARGLEFFLVILLGGGLALLLPRLGARVGAIVGGLGIAAVFGASYLAFARANYLLDPTYPAAAIALVFVVQTVLNFYREERQRAYIHQAFDRYLSPALVREIAENPQRLELGGEERDMTVLFCDIRNFSKISEQYDPKQLIEFLINFLTPMSDILLEHRATLDKYIGDAILAFWNAPLDDPDHHRNGARAALAMCAKLDELNRRLGSDPQAVWPGDVRIGIGLNSGVCCVGNMGSRQRLAYSLIGDTVNLASRLEGQTKYYGTPILTGDALARALGDEFALLEIDRIRVVGRERPETIHALLGDETMARAEDFAALRASHARVLEAYRAQDWARALSAIEDARALYRHFGLDRLAEVFEQRIAALRENPPPSDWDGVYQSTEK